jgi:hypothetical protein
MFYRSKQPYPTYYFKVYLYSVEAYSCGITLHGRLSICNRRSKARSQTEGTKTKTQNEGVNCENYCCKYQGCKGKVKFTTKKNKLMFIRF